ncbi:hypothetical protein EDB83DRAFT_1731964 [Lactarius deliciosus]|nr:hypothetical protein EDB83DRAFT_1731964 [Lactarius deliciosus]
MAHRSVDAAMSEFRVTYSSSAVARVHNDSDSEPSNMAVAGNPSVVSRKSQGRDNDHHWHDSDDAAAAYRLPLSAESIILSLPGAVENWRHRRRRRLWCHKCSHRQTRVRFLTKGAMTCTVSRTPPPWSMMHRLISITHGPSLPRAVVRPHAIRTFSSSPPQRLVLCTLISCLAMVLVVVRTGPEQPEHVPPEANILVVSYNLYYLNRNNPIIVQPYFRGATMAYLFICNCTLNA